MNKTVELEKQPLSEVTEDLPPVQTHSVEPYISEEYARAERDKLWRKVWLQVGRVEEIPEVGNYITYQILDDSILIVRSAPDTIKAFYNVCSHRGRRLIDTPPGAHHAHGKQLKFVCGFHAWSYNLEGQCTYIMDKENWQGALTDQRTRLGGVKVDTWGGWIWINLDPNSEPLRRLSRACRLAARALRAAEHALPMAPLDRVRLQLESRHGGVRRDLPRTGDAPGIHAVRQLRGVGETAG